MNQNNFILVVYGTNEKAKMSNIISPFEMLLGNSISMNLIVKFDSEFERSKERSFFAQK